MSIDKIYSRDDGGWYCEVNDASGRTVHTTQVYQTSAEAVAAARDWRDNAYKAAKTSPDS